MICFNFEFSFGYIKSCFALPFFELRNLKLEDSLLLFMVLCEGFEWELFFYLNLLSTHTLFIIHDEKRFCKGPDGDLLCNVTY